MATSQQINQAGDYQLDVIEIISYRRHGAEQKPYTMDIKPITLNVELTEDIFTSTMNGAITVYDSQDIRTVLPITGLEKLNLRFNTPGMRGINAVQDEGYPFQIYKIDEVRPDDNAPNSQLYKIYFCSVEAFKNTQCRISRAYTGTFEDAIEDIFRSKDKLNSKKNLFFEPTRNNSKYVIPSLRPFGAINLLANNALSANYANSGYHFYETPDGFHFRSIESMLAMGGAKARPSKFKFTSQIANTREGEVKDVNTDMRNVIKYDFLRPVDSLNLMRRGAYANKMITHDALNKVIKTTTFDYADSFGNYFHTEHNDGDKATDKHTLPWSKYEDYSTYADSKLMVASDTRQIHENYEFPTKETTIQQSLPQLEHVRSTTLKLLVFGNSLLRSGDVITFDLPLMRPLGNAKDKRQESNPYYGGRYMITAIKHVINIQAAQYNMVLNCMKDAVRTPYAREVDNNEINTPVGSISNIYSEDADILSGDILERL